MYIIDGVDIYYSYSLHIIGLTGGPWPHFPDRYPLHCTDPLHYIEISSPCMSPPLSQSVDFRASGGDQCSGGGSARDQQSGGKGRQLANSELVLII